MPAGRPTKLTPAVQAAICRALEMAVPLRHAAQASGVSPQQVYEWIAKGEKGIKPYAAFADAQARAQSNAVVKLTRKALAGGKGSAQSTWFLERRYRDDYGPVTKLIVENDDGLSEEERNAQIDAYRSTVMGRALSPGPHGMDDSGAGADGPKASGSSSGPDQPS